jgi:hypothetical protein
MKRSQKEVIWERSQNFLTPGLPGYLHLSIRSCIAEATGEVQRRKRMLKRNTKGRFRFRLKRPGEPIWNKDSMSWTPNAIYHMVR